ncbi:MAG: glycosyltransferase family 4 protein [Nitrospirae bacterium]|nr:glycosyltransferase family 4 protein [Nitrospirota bacterium]
MKLAFIKKTFSVHGGAENYMKTLMDHLRDKADIHIMANKWLETSGITFHKINLISLGSLLSLITFNSNVCRELKSLKADCIISLERTNCQDIYRAGEGCHREWLRLREMIEPKWKRYSFPVNPLHKMLLRIEKKIFSGTKIIVANSQMVKSQIIHHYNIPESKIKVVYNGVDLKRFSPRNAGLYRDHVRKELGIDDKTILILFVGSGFERKGLKTLLRSLSIVNSEENLRLLVIGKGNIKKFMGIAGKYNTTNAVSFLGPQKDIEKYYAAADIFILPTIYDPFSNATLEAMASGIPVITTRNNGASELITDGKEGFILEDPLDFAALAEKITRALRDYKTMGYKARLRAENYSIEKAADEFIEIISAVS